MVLAPVCRSLGICLNESPSKKEGKSGLAIFALIILTSLNESPSKKEGKFFDAVEVFVVVGEPQ